MGFPSILTMAQRWVSERVQPGDIAIDATAGGGNDTLLLAKLAGPRGRVYSFDIQLAALQATRSRLAAADIQAELVAYAGPPEIARAAGTARPTKPAGLAAPGAAESPPASCPPLAAAQPPPGQPSNGSPVMLLQASHDQMDALLPQPCRGAVAAIMFNLGYYPAADSDKHIITQPETTLAALDQSFLLLRKGGIMTIAVYPGHPGGTEEAAAVHCWAAGLPIGQAQAILYQLPQKPAAPYLLAIEKRIINH